MDGKIDTEVTVPSVVKAST
jgi:hypothetical protein